jgi:hypothetical protein
MVIYFQFPRTVLRPCQFQLPTNSSKNGWITGRNMWWRQNRSFLISESNKFRRSNLLKIQKRVKKSLTELNDWKISFSPEQRLKNMQNSLKYIYKYSFNSLVMYLTHVIILPRLSSQCFSMNWTTFIFSPPWFKFRHDTALIIINIYKDNFLFLIIIFIDNGTNISLPHTRSNAIFSQPCDK